MEQPVLFYDEDVPSISPERNMLEQKHIRSRDEIIEARRQKRVVAELAHAAVLETPYGELGGSHAEYSKQQQDVDVILSGMWSRERDQAIELGLFDVTEAEYETMIQRDRRRYTMALVQYNERLKTTHISQVIQVNVKGVEEEMDASVIPALRQYRNPETGKLPTRDELLVYADAIDGFKQWVFGHPVSRLAVKQIPRLSTKERATPMNVTLSYDDRGKLRCDRRTAQDKG